MSKVSNPKVQSTAPANLNQTSPTVTTAGTSDGGFRFYGVIGAANCTVVLTASSNRTTPTLNSTSNGIIADPGTIGTYLLLTTDSANANNWTVRARTTKDGAGNGITFTAGTGGDDDETGSDDEETGGDDE